MINKNWSSQTAISSFYGFIRVQFRIFLKSMAALLVLVHVEKPPSGGFGVSV